jgi:hypothetical protein
VYDHVVYSQSSQEPCNRWSRRTLFLLYCNCSQQTNQSHISLYFHPRLVAGSQASGPYGLCASYAGNLFPGMFRKSTRRPRSLGIAYSDASGQIRIHFLS